MNDLLNKLKAKFNDAKSRSFLIMIGAIICIGLTVAVVKMRKQQALNSISGGGSNVAELAGNIDSSPGVGSASQEYNKLRYEKNSKQTEQAEATGGSAVPTIVSDQVVETQSAEDVIKQEQARLAKERQTAYARLLEQRRQEETTQQQTRLTAQQSAEMKARQESYEALMVSQAQTLFAGWSNVPRQSYMGGTGVTAKSAEAAQQEKAGQTAQGAKAKPGNILYKAGDIVYAVLETSINSDEQGPIMAKIVQGPLNGAKIIGSYAPAGPDAEKLTLNFTMMNIPNRPSSIGFTGVAIDPETARVALASNVDHHYLLRYGSMFGTAFLQGAGNLVLSRVNNPGYVVDANGNSVPAKADTTGRDLAIVGLGNIANTIAQNSNLFSTKPTITLEAGTGFGLLMMADLNIDAEPASPQVAAPAVNQNAINAAVRNAIQQQGMGQGTAQGIGPQNNFGGYGGGFGGGAYAGGGYNSSPYMRRY